MRRSFKSNMILLLSLVIVAAIVGSSYAYLAATDAKIINSFQFAQIDTSITEKTGPEGKKEVTVSNDNISSVYVRAKVLVSGGDAGVASGNVSFAPDPATMPSGKEITVVYNATNWYYDEENGWFYYLSVLKGTEADGSKHATKPLIYRVLVGDGVEHTESFEVDVYQESALTSKTENPDNWTIVRAAFEGR